MEVEPFRSRAKGIWTDAEIEALIDFISINPEAGKVIPGTGGLRKIRWQVSQKGKRAGARVVYYFHGDSLPVFLLTAYAKGATDQLTKAQEKTIATLAGHLARSYGKE